ncbi:MAG: hypothetical protein V5A62_16060 [Haloarculaceae archaeon]
MSTDGPPQTESPTNSILVVLDAEDPEPTLQAVVEETDATTVEMDGLAVYPTVEYEVRRRARCDADVPGPYTLDQPPEEARRVARLLPDVVSVEAVEDVPAPSDDPNTGVVFDPDPGPERSGEP